MHSRTVEQVRTWDSRPFSGGLGTLSELADSDHTGAVVASDTWLFMLNGRVIGIFEGTMDDFESSGTVYSTPHDSLPLLFAMQEREGRTRAKYFTEDTPLAEADQTLADANFTGYIVLSENVLSGDYYLVYYGGTRRSVAFVGQSERVETGEDAFEMAAEEVGLYEVRDVSMTITEIPTPQADRSANEAAAVAGTDDSKAEPVGDPGREPPESSAGTGIDVETGADDTPARESGEEPAGAESETESEPAAATQTTEPADSDPGSAEPEPNEVGEEPAQGTASERVKSGSGPTTSGKPGSAIDAAEPERDETAQTTAPGSSRGDSSAGEQPDRGRPSSASESTDPAGDAEQPEGDDSDLEQMFRAEEEWRRTRAIPALDPDETEPTDTTGSSTPHPGTNQPAAAKRTASSNATTQEEARRARDRGVDAGSRAKDRTVESQSTPDQVATGQQTASRQSRSNQREAVRSALKEREEQIEDLEARLSSIEQERSTLEAELEEEQDERSRLESELADLRAERDTLATRVEELEAAMEAEGTTAGSEPTTLQPAEALAGTNLFVRYGSKSEPTLEALGNDVDPDAVNANLQLEHHTQFETESVQVEGHSFRDFLEGTGEFRFVSWVLRELPYELLETGNRNSLGDLFEAIGAIDRIEFNGSITVDPESGADREFALVMRDRMGNPLVVGEYNDSRNPVRDGELETLLDGARDVAATADSLAGAFYVTASFFEPGALERAEKAAATGGLFSRQEKASFVSPDSGTGFHLGLIEDRSQTFHVTVPKL